MTVSENSEQAMMKKRRFCLEGSSVEKREISKAITEAQNRRWSTPKAVRVRGEERMAARVRGEGRMLIMLEERGERYRRTVWVMKCGIGEVVKDGTGGEVRSRCSSTVQVMEDGKGVEVQVMKHGKAEEVRYS